MMVRKPSLRRLETPHFLMLSIYHSTPCTLTDSDYSIRIIIDQRWGTDDPGELSVMVSTSQLSVIYGDLGEPYIRH